MIFEKFIIFFTLVTHVSGDGQKHLGHCLHNIILRHFTSELPCVVSLQSPKDTLEKTSFMFQSENIHILIATEDGIPDSILRDLNEAFKKSIIVYNHEYENDAMIEDSKIKHESYILFHQNGNVIQDIRGQLIRLKSNSAWNARAYFVVIIMQSGGLPLQNRTISETQMVQVFAEFWKYNAIDVIVLLQSTKLLHSRETPTIEVYTWFPYSEIGRCAQVIDCVLLDVWITNQDGVGNFLHNASLFPPKIPKYFPGCPFRVSTFESDPFVMYPSYNEDGKAVTFRGGLEIEFLQMIQKATNITIVFREPPSDGKWGALLDNGSWTGVLREVIEGVSDVALGGLYYRCHITDVIECATPYMYDALIWYIPCAQPNPRWASLSRVFKLSLWLGFIVGYITVSIITWAVVQICNTFATAERESSAYTNMAKCFLNLWAVILGMSATEDIPQKVVIRIVFFLWVVYSLAVNTVYQTFLTSYMVDPGLQHQISSVGELLDSGLEYGIYSSFDSLMPDLRNKLYERRQIFDDIEDCARRLAAKGDFAFLYSKINTDYITAVRYVDSNGHPLFCHMDENFSPQYITLSVQRGSPMLKRYNDVIQGVVEGGLLDKCWKVIKFKGILLAAKNLTVPVGDFTPLSMEHLQSAFYVLILGCFISLVPFSVEVFFHKRS